jgi:hypothetical protein
MREWMIAQGIATAQELDEFEKEDLAIVRDAQRRAWEAYRAPIDAEVQEAIALLDIASARRRTERTSCSATRRRSAATPSAPSPRRSSPQSPARIPPTPSTGSRDQTSAKATSATTPISTARASDAALRIEKCRPQYADDAPMLNGFEIINTLFDHALRRDPRVIIFGEDVGKLGDVNQGCLGLQEKYGVSRVMDTGIRECTIVGQAIGAALRGLRPIAEIQYLDYILYALQILSDDLATTALALRRRAEGAGDHPHARPSPRRHLALRLADGRHHQPRARHPRLRPAQHDAGRRLLQHAPASDDPAIVIEVLNGYRSERKAAVEHRRLHRCRSASPRCFAKVKRRHAGVLRRDAAHRAWKPRSCSRRRRHRRGSDRRADAAAVRRARRDRRVAEEDEPRRLHRRRRPRRRDRVHDAAGARARPRLRLARLRAAHHRRKEHRPAYGSDGDYWSKPNRETIFAACTS